MNGAEFPAGGKIRESDGRLGKRRHATKDLCVPVHLSFSLSLSYLRDQVTSEMSRLTYFEFSAPKWPDIATSDSVDSVGSR